MSPQEQAALWVQAGQLMTAKTLGEASDLLATAIREAIAAEREACARVADEMPNVMRWQNSNERYAAQLVAAAIRARGET